jgi:hypothetical protein
VFDWNDEATRNIDKLVNISPSILSLHLVAASLPSFYLMIRNELNEWLPSGIVNQSKLSKQPSGKFVNELMNSGTFTNIATGIAGDANSDLINDPVKSNQTIVDGEFEIESSDSDEEYDEFDADNEHNEDDSFRVDINSIDASHFVSKQLLSLKSKIDQCLVLLNNKIQNWSYLANDRRASVKKIDDSSEVLFKLDSIANILERLEEYIRKNTYNTRK